MQRNRLFLVGTQTIIFVGGCAILDYLRHKIPRFFIQNEDDTRNSLVESKFKTIVVSLGNFVLSNSLLYAVFPLILQPNISTIHNNVSLEAVKLIIMLIASDLLFYVTHRLLHNKHLYKHFHKMHHKHVHPISWTSFYFHPVEMIINFANVLILPTLLFNKHPITLNLYFSILNLSLIKSHCGIDLFGIYTSKYHFVHHRLFNVNYSSELKIWDRLFGTIYTQPIEMIH